VHLPLALDGEGRKLSKQERALAIDDADPLPALRASLAFLGQPAPAATTVQAMLAEALRNFDPRRIPRNAAAPQPFAAMREELS
jgi:glutamyl-Q tRNA(Asp) synthetase